MQGSITDDLYNLAQGPFGSYKIYNEFIVNGFRFHTKYRQEIRKSQNFGVLCKGVDNLQETEYYGLINEIWELEYPGSNFIYLFNCEWFKDHKIDKYEIVSVNVNHRLRTNEPFILSSQAVQVFYVEDPKDSNWLIVMKTQPRDSYNIPMNGADLEGDSEILNIDIEDAYQEDEYNTSGHATRPLDDDDQINELGTINSNDLEVPIEVVELIEEDIIKSSVPKDDDLHEFMKEYSEYETEENSETDSND